MFMSLVALCCLLSRTPVPFDSNLDELVVFPRRKGFGVDDGSHDKGVDTRWASTPPSKRVVPPETVAYGCDGT